VKNDKQRDWFPGVLEMMVLQTLRRLPLHGCAVVRHIKRSSNDLLQVEEGSLDLALRQTPR
jgi:PadR family transcriptional regulator PadR